jgi:hypothetical protein
MAPTAKALARFVALSAVFAVVYCQAPLYYSNQHQYFLHGLALAGEGLLRDDWLAGTRDPTPVFSVLVAVTARLLHPWMFHAYYALLMGAYAWAMLGLFRFLVGQEVARRRWPLFLAGLLLVHSALARWASYRWLNLDYPWYFQAGVAGQYVLGAVFQPSAFGVLLVVAVALFLKRRPYLAAVCVGAAGTFHSTYLLAGGLLTAGFLAALAARGEFRRAVKVGALALGLVAPVTAYTAIAFAPTSVEAFRQAQAILVDFRIPHHTRPDLWLDRIAGLQIAWVAVAVWSARGTPLAWVLGVPLALSSALTLGQWLSASNTLALLFPWRISSVLVPIATTVILSRVVSNLLPRERPVGWKAPALVALCLVLGGLWITLGHKGFHANDNELGVLEYVRGSKKEGEVYFIPVTVPRLAATTRGSLSSDFKPLPGKRADPRLIPVDFQRFRLPTGAPLYVDFKSVPYADLDVIEWRQRIGLAEDVQRELEARREVRALELLRGQGVTHLVWPASQELLDARWEKVYEDSSYRVYRLPEGGAPRGNAHIHDPEGAVGKACGPGRGPGKPRRDRSRNPGGHRWTPRKAEEKEVERGRAPRVVSPRRFLFTASVLSV